MYGVTSIRPTYAEVITFQPLGPIHIFPSTVLREIEDFAEKSLYGDPKVPKVIRDAIDRIAPWINGYDNLTPSLLSDLKKRVARWKDPDSYRGLEADYFNPSLYSSRQGLIYGDNIRDGHTIYHIHSHFFPEPSKAIHSMYAINDEMIFELIDEAWRKKSGAGHHSCGKTTYDIPMGRVIGTDGETKIRIVVKEGTKQVVTAFPIKR